MATYIIRVARRAGIILLFAMSASLGVASGVFFAYAGDIPRISALDDYAPSTITRLKALDGAVIGEFATQRRIVIGYDGRKNSAVFAISSAVTAARGTSIIVPTR